MIKKEDIQKVDRILLACVGLLIFFGLLIIYSTSSIRTTDPNLFLKAHAAKIAFGFLVLLIVSKIDYHAIRWITPFLILLGIGLIILVLHLPTPEHIKVNRWIFYNNRQIFQPSELMKIVMVLYFAAIFAKGVESKYIEGNAIYGQFAFLLLVSGIIFLEPDLGTALVVFFMGLAMLFLAGVSIKRIIVMTSGTLLLVMVGIRRYPYQMERIVNFMNSFKDESLMSHQVKQAFIGLAQGGLMGVGYGEGKQRFFWLPEPFSDFILASLGEELGFIGIFIVFTLLFVILWRGIRIASKAPDRYGFLLAGGITCMILINAIINAAVVVNLLPTTGLPFPFLSYGGSSLMVQMIGIGILLNISKQQNMKKKRAYVGLGNW